MDRKLATIFASDVVGFSKMMGTDEVKTLEILKERRQVIDSIIDDHGGIIFGSAGDSVIAEFASPIKAAEAALETQLKMNIMNEGKSDDKRMIFRVGINIGDVMITEDNLFGDAVNIAARLEAAAKPSGICISQTVFDMINRKITVSFEDAGQLELKNIEFPINAFHVIPSKGTPRWTQKTDSLETEIKEPEPGSVAVLLFKNLSNDEEQDYFCEGFSEDLLSILAKFNNLVVVASQASFSYKDSSISIKDIGKELGVKYLIKGSVRKLGPKMRINAQLLASDRETSLWSNNYDLSSEEVFDVQDEIAGHIVSTIVGKVEDDVLENIKAKRPENMSAYELVLKGLEYAKSGNIVKDNLKKAIKLFDQAIEADPTYSRAHAWKSCSLANLSDWEESDDPNYWDNVIDIGYKALELDPNDPEANRIMGSIKFYFEKDYELGKHHFEKAKNLNPSDIWLISRYVLMLIYMGDIEKAISEIQRAMRLDPFSNDVLIIQEGICHYWLKDYDKSINCFQKIKIPGYALFYLAAAHMKNKNSERAIEKIKEAKAITGQSVDEFVNSLSYTKDDMVEDLLNTLNSISV